MAFRRILTILCSSLTRPRMKALPVKTLFPQQISARCSGMLPKSQYDHPGSKKMKFPQVLRKNWEIIPLFVTTGAAMTLMFGAIIWSIMHKVDVVFKTHSRKNISRTMDLRCPTKHKFIIINQKYRPWPQMHKALEKIRNEECRRAGQSYPFPDK